jgi:PAS domain S-box-containing protein
VVESAPNVMVMIRETGLTEMVNAQAEAVFGYSRAEMLGQPVDRQLQAGDRHEPAMR